MFLYSMFSKLHTSIIIVFFKFAIMRGLFFRLWIEIYIIMVLIAIYIWYIHVIFRIILEFLIFGMKIMIKNYWFFTDLWLWKRLADNSRFIPLLFGIWHRINENKSIRDMIFLSLSDKFYFIRNIISPLKSTPIRSLTR